MIRKNIFKIERWIKLYLIEKQKNTEITIFEKK